MWSVEFVQQPNCDKSDDGKAKTDLLGREFSVQPGVLISLLAGMLSLLCLLVLFLSSGPASLAPDPGRPAAPAPGQYRAAVYEHELVLAGDCTTRLCSRQEAIQHMEVCSIM